MVLKKHIFFSILTLFLSMPSVPGYASIEKALEAVGEYVESVMEAKAEIEAAQNFDGEININKAKALELSGLLELFADADESLRDVIKKFDEFRDAAFEWEKAQKLTRLVSRTQSSRDVMALLSQISQFDGMLELLKKFDQLAKDQGKSPLSHVATPSKMSGDFLMAFRHFEYLNALVSQSSEVLKLHLKDVSKKLVLSSFDLENQLQRSLSLSVEGPPKRGGLQTAIRVTQKRVDLMEEINMKAFEKSLALDIFHHVFRGDLAVMHPVGEIQRQTTLEIEVFLKRNGFGNETFEVDAHFLRTLLTKEKTYNWARALNISKQVLDRGIKLVRLGGF